MSLSPGAARLPPAHLSARVAWHDTDWTGRVCEAPGANHACTVLKNVKERKSTDVEEAIRGTAWADIEDTNDVPPCVFERAGFMRPKGFSIDRDHRYAGGWTQSHEHFATTTHHMPAYSVEATPYRWTLREEAPKIARAWGISYDESLEQRADEIIETQKPTDWVQDHRNQLSMLDSFFSAVVPGSSLLFLYAKDIPLVEEREPGARMLIGVGRITQVRPVVEWNYTDNGPLRSVMWERSVLHSIRPSHEDGFLLPYHELLADPSLQGKDLSPFIARSPHEHFDEFSYVSELMTDDAAIAALTELARVVDLLPGVVDGPWGRVATWLSDRLGDAWEARGSHPGLGPALSAAGIERGAIVAHRIVESLDHSEADPWPSVEQAVAESASGSGPVAGLVGRMARKSWQRVVADEERYRLLRLIARFSLSSEQARRLFDPAARAEHSIGVTDGELLDNPYLIYELDRGRLDSVGLGSIDRGMFTQSAAARVSLRADPLPEPVEEAADDRRVRAACVEILEHAGEEGHTLLDEPGLRRRLAALELDPQCDPTTDLFELATEEFGPVLVQVGLAGDRGRGWQLQRFAQTTGLIADALGRRVHDGPLAAEWDWDKAIDHAIGETVAADDALERAAREEKAAALCTLAQSRVGVLLGAAGTGKTTMLKALCTHPGVATGGVLLLAPTGKARVQLGDKAGLRAQTLAQFLRPTRWSVDGGYRLNVTAPPTSGYRTVVVDEASMLTEEMLAALLEAITDVDRFVLCGDHRQLPPIGAGRPFADLVTYLRANEGEGSGGGVAELHIGRRLRVSAQSTSVQRQRDDLAVASAFSRDGPGSGADEALGRVIGGGGDGTITILSWEDEEDLHEKLVEQLDADGDLVLKDRSVDALRRSLGATATYNGGPSFPFGSSGIGAERWQILSPVRSRTGGVAGLNRLIRATWRAGDATRARRSWKLPDPAGADELLFFDKVMCVENHRRDAWIVADKKVRDGEVANGEIGMAVGWPRPKKGKPTGLKLEFSTQPGVQFTFWISQLNADRERASEILEVAYAITVHKAQGSQFETTFVVVPNPSPLLSPELLYTALTRHRGRVVLLVQSDPAELRKLADPARSEIARRLTCLFTPADPFTTLDGTVLDGSHVDRSANGELMRSKSEVIVANTLRSLGIDYSYEEILRMADGTVKEPDFTIRRRGDAPVYWEHLGMMDLAGYNADWKAKQQWYADHDILPWTEGGGSAGTLVWSTEKQTSAGIDSQEIEQLALEVFGGRAS